MAIFFIASFKDSTLRSLLGQFRDTFAPTSAAPLPQGLRLDPLSGSLGPFGISECCLGKVILRHIPLPLDVHEWGLNRSYNYFIYKVCSAGRSNNNWKPYMEMNPFGKNARSKRRDAKDALAAIAGSGENVDKIVMDIAGYKNHTTEMLLKAFAECGDATTESIRLQKVSLLYPLRNLPLHLVRGLGFNVGKDLWHTVQTYNPWLFEESCKMASKSGRNMSSDPSVMKDAWLSIAHDTSSDKKKLFYGSRAQAALLVRKAMGGKSTLRTILNHRPRCILFTTKPTDLCPICVQLKRMQKSLATCAGPKTVIKKNTKDMLRKISILQRHKDYVCKVRSEYAEDFKKPNRGTLTMCVDWSSPVKVTSTTGTSDEFFKPSFAQCIGAHASYMSPDGKYSTVYLHAYGPIGSYTNKNASFSCNATFFLVRKACEALCRKKPTRINLWFDTARHFKNKVMLHELPSSIFRDICPREVTIAYHVPHHGKTPLDGSFRRSHSWIGTGVDLQQIEDGSLSQEVAFRNAYSAQMTSQSYKVFLYPVATPWACRQIVAPRISDISKATFRIRGDASISYDDGSEIPFKKFESVPQSATRKCTVHKKKRVARKKCYVGQVMKKFSI